ncbi:DUF5689 domain-containing protein [Flavobacterium capsici]|uniref:DUF5689 domain-containing protein n=1 Tax=Flavobacterium capsici TaxID=3075618 RepID=A0AA96J753_9FLAO|nr:MULTISPECIES: DUF5689 domain-containing protein [unclassified Flavobacterium]WNM19582.1 DUF5689 domain-containing protein [Flavobacterium sp. PMR2A8]WNM20971.1 DUF5689 domain-containing protein [Flavobacterium sp. PMTSA4]
MKNLKLVLTAFVFAAIFSCANDDHYSTPDLSNECVSISKTKEVLDITSIATASATQYTPAEGLNEDYIEAYVTSSDEGGNFYKSISMMNLDGTVGFSMPVDNYNLFNEFEPGRKVTIKLDKNRYFNKQHGSTVLGSSYNNGVGRVSGVEYKDVIFRSCDNVNEDNITKHLTVAQAKNDQYLNMLIEFDAVQFTNVSLDKKYFDASVNNLGGATNHEITDKFGNKIIVRVSEYAKFAGDKIPSGNGKIRGVLTKYNNDYQFMIRTLEDVHMMDTRYVPTTFFEESFATNFPNWVVKNVTGSNQWAVQASFGNPTYNAFINGFGNNNEDWLISPSINLSTNTFAILSFETSTRFSGPALQVFVSTDYDGTSAPNTATWTQLTGFNLPAWTSGTYTSWSAGASGGINISSYTGNSNVRVAFKYTSTTSSAAAWEVDNVKVVGQ